MTTSQDPFDTPGATQNSKAPEPDRDRWGRYVLPDPSAGDKSTKSWTRATTFAKSIMDTYGLGQWGARMAVEGVSLRPDLYALAAATDIDDRKKLDEIADQAKDAAKSKEGSNLGTALHAFSEQVDRGDHVTIPAPWDKDIAAYTTALSQQSIRVLPDMIERVVVVPDYGVAGTLDRVVEFEGGLFIADLKTGKDLSYSWGEIAVQLALYAHAPMIWDTAAKAYRMMPPNVSREVGFVFHVPAGKATCTVYTVDLKAGWEASRLCQEVRAWRSRKDLASVFGEPVEEKPKRRTRKAPAKKPESAKVAEKLTTPPVVDPPTTVEPLAPGEDNLLDRMLGASSREEIRQIWVAAKEAGQANAELKAAGTRRANELLSPAGLAS